MRFRYQSRQKEYEIDLERIDGHYSAVVNGDRLEFELLDSGPGELCLLMDSQITRIFWAAEAGKTWISLDGCTYELHQPTGQRREGQHSLENLVRAPMPGQVRMIQVSEGEQVETNQTLMILEAMKMEMRLVAPRNAIVTRILVKPGQVVAREQSLIELSDD